MSELTKLFQKNQNKSLYITMKRYDSALKTRSKSSQTQSIVAENKCLIRVHTSKKKISTIVSSKDVNKFQLVSHCLKLMLIMI